MTIYEALSLLVQYNIALISAITLVVTVIVFINRK